LQSTEGDLSEWLKEHAWKACKRETVSRVRIPQSPPDELKTHEFSWVFCFAGQLKLALRRPAKQKNCGEAASVLSEV